MVSCESIIGDHGSVLLQVLFQVLCLDEMDQFWWSYVLPALEQTLEDQLWQRQHNMLHTISCLVVTTAEGSQGAEFECHRGHATECHMLGLVDQEGERVEAH